MSHAYILNNVHYMMILHVLIKGSFVIKISSPALGIEPRAICISLICHFALLVASTLKNLTEVTKTTTVVNGSITLVLCTH